MKNVTIKDVAKAAGVSYSTVSRALSGSPEISVDTRERILQVCKEMNYTANTVARAMVMKSTKLLGLILTGVNNPFMSDLPTISTARPGPGGTTSFCATPPGTWSRRRSSLS